MIWRVPCGDYTIYAIEDGYVYRNPLEQFPNSTEADWIDQVVEPDGTVRHRYGCFLVQADDRLLMVDAGMGTHRSGDFVAGRTSAALDKLAVDRGDIEMVVFTHMHFDHIGGSVSPEGESLYPNARHVFHRVEWDHWSTADTQAGEAARWTIEPLLDAGLVDFVEGAFPAGPGIQTVETPGHTPGHLSVQISSGSTEALIGGDMSNHPIQVQHPDWCLPVDNDWETAEATRRRVFGELAGSGILFLAGHYPAPGIGVITTDGEVNRFTAKPVGSAIAE
jgi:glyoxylase-like metal-dependent hydrolase (beta-lactamase superfamily II)